MPTNGPDEPPPDASSDPLADQLAQCLEAMERFGPAAVEAILAKVPQHRARLQEALLQLEGAGLLPEHAGGAGASEGMPERLGEFRMLRRIGGGGMGVVYLAEQESLGRQVAIKLVRPDQLWFGGARARFRREVELVARLQDPGIVPIHTVGNEGGIPFFAMEHVAGGSFADVLQALAARREEVLDGRDLATVVAARAGVPVVEPLPELFHGPWWQCVCRIVERMAAAVAHAHERGVVHRDLKPSNALVSPSGRVLLCDFGLATDGTSPLTQAGQQLGTLQYMAPEQLRGEAVDERTDVYGLGVTLYELLAREPAFVGANREVLRQRILAGQVASLAERRGAGPRDLDIVCAKAMALEPGRRYDSAAALAADLANVRAGRPIAARPAGPWLRLWRWRARHPVAAAVALVAGLTLGGIVVLWPDVGGLRAAAERNLRAVLATIEQQLARANGPEFASAPGLDRLRQDEVEAAVATLQRLRGENPDDPRLGAMWMEGMLAVGQLRVLLDQPEAAESMFAAVEAELQRAAPAPTDIRQGTLRGAVLLARGELLRWRGEPGPAERRLDEAVLVLEPVVASASATARARRDLAAALANRGALRVLRGQLDAGEADLVRAKALQPMAADAGPVARRERLRSDQTLALLAHRRGHFEVAKGAWTGLLVEFAALATKAPKDPELARETARCKTGLANALASLRDLRGAAGALAEAVALLDGIVAAFPGRVVYRWERNLIAMQCGQMFGLCEDLPSALRHLRAAVDDQERLCTSHPARHDFGNDLARMLGCLAVQLGRGEQEHEVGPLLVRAVAIQERVVEAVPDGLLQRAQLANLRSNLALQRLHEDDVATASRLIELAIGAFEGLLEAGERVMVAEHQYGFSLRLAAQIAANAHDAEQAMARLTAVQQFEPMPRQALADFGGQLGVVGRPDFQVLLAAAR